VGHASGDVCQMCRSATRSAVPRPTRLMRAPPIERLRTEFELMFPTRKVDEWQSNHVKIQANRRV